jgi:hypothetical protein
MYMRPQEFAISDSATGGKYVDVTWIRGGGQRRHSLDRGTLDDHWIAASNDSRQESIGDRLLFAFFKKNVSTLGRGRSMTSASSFTKDSRA